VCCIRSLRRIKEGSLSSVQISLEICMHHKVNHFPIKLTILHCMIASSSLSYLLRTYLDFINQFLQQAMERCQCNHYEYVIVSSSPPYKTIETRNPNLGKSSLRDYKYHKYNIISIYKIQCLYFYFFGFHTIMSLLKYFYNFYLNTNLVVGNYKKKY